MRNLNPFVLSAFLTGSILLFARTQAQAPQQNQQNTPTELTEVCREKHPPPCATPPRAIYSPAPEYSSQARKAGYQGVCTLVLIVEADGRPTHIRVSSSLGMGLDEKAIEAVKRWRFAPALKDGKPVPVQITIEISFHTYTDTDRGSLVDETRRLHALSGKVIFRQLRRPTTSHTSSARTSSATTRAQGKTSKAANALEKT